MVTNYSGRFLYLSNAVNKPDRRQKVKDACSVHSLLDKVFDTFSVRTVNYEEDKKTKKDEEKIRKNKPERQSKKLPLPSNRFAALQISDSD